MHHSPYEIKDKLLKALDKENNVVDMALAMEVITLLERTPITKEALEATRLGKYINEMRKKTHNELLARRAKDLVRRWRDMVVTKPTENGTGGTGPGPGAGTGGGATPYNNNNKPAVTPPSGMFRVASSPALTSMQRGVAGAAAMSSPALARPNSRNNAKPVVSPALRQVASSPAFKPVLSPEFASSASTSPSLTFSAHGSRPTTPSMAAMIRSRVISPGPGRPATGLSALSPVSPGGIGGSFSNSSSYAPKTEGVAKTHAANKRLRKDDDEDDGNSLPESKRPRTTMNGVEWMDEESRGSTSSLISVEDKTPLVLEETSNSAVDVQEKKQRRGRKAEARKEAMSDVLKQKFASIARTPKVKTTQQLLEDLAKRSGSPSLASKAETLTAQQDSLAQEANRAKEFAASSRQWEANSLSKLWKSQTAPQEGVSVAPATSERLPVPTALGQAPVESVEDILAKLPPIDPTVLEEPEGMGQEEELSRVKVEVSEKLIERLHSEPCDHVNGTRDYQNQFREWHETLSVPSHQGSLLHLLPYCVID